MNIKRFQHLFGLALILLLVGCGGGGSSSGGTVAPPPAVTPTTPSNLVIAIGDSIGNGFGIATPWPDRLAGLIQREIVNNSVTNEQASFGVSVIQAMIDENNPSHVFILLGTNDALRGSVGAAVSDLQTMVDIANQNNVIAVVGTLPPITRDAAEDARAAEISAGIRDLTGARLAPVRGMISASNIVDGVHPNNEGQQQIAEAFATQF